MTKRVLHIVGGMNRGGVETWLMHVLRNIDRERFQMDFLVHTAQPCAYDDEIRSLSSRIIPCLHPSRPLLYARNFRRILNEYGPYDVVHSHVHHYSGYVLRLAKSEGIPVRIAHSHSDTSALQASAGLRRRCYLWLMRHWIMQYATARVGVSRQASSALFGPDWESDSCGHLLYYGIDLSPFKTNQSRAEVRSELGLPLEAFVIGHVGRFDEPKNHHFLTEIIIEVIKRKPETYALLVGDGPLRPSIEHQVNEASLAERVVFAGLRADVPRLMLGAMDVFLMPSLYEGLPLVLIEAQAAGLPRVISDIITDEVDIVKPDTWRQSLTASPSRWAAAVLSTQSDANHIPQAQALSALSSTPFNILNGLALLTNLYESGQLRA